MRKSIKVKSKTKMKTKSKKLPYVIVTTDSARVFSGELFKRKGRDVILLNARQIWAWEGIANLSDLAMRGTCKPNECRFTCEVSKVELFETIEILYVTEKARKSINSVPVWSAHE